MLNDILQFKHKIVISLVIILPLCNCPFSTLEENSQSKEMSIKIHVTIPAFPLYNRGSYACSVMNG